MAKRRPSLAGDMRHIANCLERLQAPRFAAVIREASKQISELRWENGVLRGRLKRVTTNSATKVHK